MSRSTKTPSKKKQTPAKHQKNTLDSYFSAPKNSSEGKPQIIDENEKNVPNINPGSKRKLKTTNIVGVKLRKVDATSVKNSVAENTNIPNESGDHHLKLVLETVNILDIQQNQGISNDQPTNVSLEPVNQKPTNKDITNKRQEKNNSGVAHSERMCSKNKIPKLRRKCGQVGWYNVNETTPLLRIEPLDSSLECSVNDSVVIDSISTPKNTAKNRLPILLSKETNSVVRPFDRTNEGESSTSQVSHLSTSPPTEKNCLERKRIPATAFKEVVYSLSYSDFSEPYQKLGSSSLPECYDFGKCQAMHKGTKPSAVNSFQYGHVFNILDCPLTDWHCDLLPAISLVMSRDQYLRGDMLRMLFDYILNGPNEYLMWDIKAILESHWYLHPPCTDHMQELYVELLDRRYRGESFFMTKLTDSGVLMYVMDEMEKVLKTEMDEVEINGNENKLRDDNQSLDSSQRNLTYDLLLERFINHQPLFDEERQQAWDNLDDLFKTCSQLGNEMAVLDKPKTLSRLTIALEIIVDLLETDFMICVSRLKSSIKEECKVRIPIVKHIVDETFQSKVLTFFVTTTNTSTWKQLSRIIGLIAETVHLFSNSKIITWKYPNLLPGCTELASAITDCFIKGSWGEDECLSRLQSLHPPWLQHRVALDVANSHLNLVLGTGIQAVADIIHTHVVSPVVLEKDVRKIDPDVEILYRASEKMLKASKKKNQYGETLLHRVCMNAKFTVRDLECLLAMPDTDINVKDNHGWTPLHEAVNSSCVPKVEMLLQFLPPQGRREAVEVGAQNNDGITPLHEAVELGNLAMCKLLVDCGGICLLRKKNNEGVTPLMLSKNREEINKFFKSVIKTQEQLNLNSNSVLKLPDAMIKMCMVVCDAFISDHHTWELYQVFKYDKDYVKAEPTPYISGTSKDILLKFKHEQKHFRKLRKIIEKLAENPENSYLVRLWNNRFRFH